MVKHKPYILLQNDGSTGNFILKFLINLNPNETAILRNTGGDYPPQPPVGIKANARIFNIDVGTNGGNSNDSTVHLVSSSISLESGEKYYQVFVNEPTGADPNGGSSGSYDDPDGNN